MKATEALRKMVKSSGKTALQISREIGRKPNYVSSLLHRGSTPTVETFASIAKACGATLRLEFAGESLELGGWDVEATEDVPIE